MIPDDLPDEVLRLATAVSIAARVEPELLRSARLRLLPGVHVSAEADLWFSELVTRSAKRVVLLPEVAAALREKLAADAELLHAARVVVAESHANAPDLVQLEEEITYLALTGGDVQEEINTKLLRVLNTIALQTRPGVIDWFIRALPRMPRNVQETTAAYALDLVCGTGRLPSMGVRRSVMDNPALTALVVRALPLTTMWARLVPLDDGLGVEMSRSEMVSAHVIELSETKPLLIEVTTNQRSEIVELPADGAVVVPISGDAALRTIAGDVYLLAETRTAPQDLSSLSMDELLDLYSKPSLTEGEVVRGRVVKVNPSDVIIDIGYKSEGRLPIAEVMSQDGIIKVKRGDEIEVFIERLADSSGYVTLSREKAARLQVWDEIEDAYKADQPISGRVVDRVKGGMAVDVGGIKAFLPASLIDTKPVKNLDGLRGHEMKFKIVSLDKKRGTVVLSRKAIVEVEQVAAKAATFRRLEEGKLTHGIVRHITDYGVFVDLGGVDGLLHITDISWGRVMHPSDYFNVGDEIDVIVLKFDPVSERVSLGYKQKSPDPWAGVQERYPLGHKVTGKVVSLTDYGMFIELEEGVEGLIHVSEMSWTKTVRDPSKLFTIGNEVTAVVADVNIANRRISLSLKALEQNPWDTIAERYPAGAVIEGKVRDLSEFGAFVEVEEGIDGLIHISDMSWHRRLKHPSEVLKKGDTVKARVINVDGENQRLSLSIREFLPHEWDNFAKEHNLGDEVIGAVSKITDFGLFIRLAEGVEGLAHVSEVVRDPRQKLAEMFQVGEPLRVRIIRIDTQERKIALTLRGVSILSEDERRRWTRSQMRATDPLDEDPSN